VGLKWGPLSLLSTIKELLERKSNGSGLENRVYGRGNPTTRHPLSAKIGTTSSTSGGRSVDIVLLPTKATGFVLYSYIPPIGTATTYVLLLDIVKVKLSRNRPWRPILCFALFVYITPGEEQ
jgi:hypothetical protein